MALSAERNTPQLDDVERSPISYKMKGSTKVYKGSLVALNTGLAAPGATATGRVAVGRAKKTIDNGSGADKALEVEVEEGIFKWANSGGDAVVDGDIGATVYIEDDQTVCHTSTSKSAAGKCVRIDTDGVWVKTVL